MKLIVNKNGSGFETKEFLEYLKTPTPKSEITKDEADELRKTLEDAHKKYGGLGISATQLGIKKRVCYINFGEGENAHELFLVNPIIKERSNEGFIFYEGCLSIPKTISNPIKTIRSCKVVVDTDNMGELTFEVNQEKDRENDMISADTMKTVVIQHEIDHLDGITIMDRVYSTTIVNNQKIGRNDKIIMKSPTGELIEVKYKNANKYYLEGYEIV